MANNNPATPILSKEQLKKLIEELDLPTKPKTAAKPKPANNTKPTPAPEDDVEAILKQNFIEEE